MSDELKPKIMVVDDEKVVRDFLARLLSLKNLSVKTAENGFQAIEMAKAEPFDFIFLDVRMPGIDGVQTLRELKKIPGDTKYVMMTGYSVDGLLEEARKENILASIKKPFDINQIIAFVAEHARETSAVKIPIMVIDDDQNILDFFKRLLKDKLYEVSAMTSAASALELLKERDFDLVFLDVFLGETNGIELYERIRRIKPKTQVVLITGNCENIQESIKDLDVRGCIFKPFDIEKIFSEIDKVEKSKTA